LAGGPPLAGGSEKPSVWTRDAHSSRERKVTRCEAAPIAPYHGNKETQMSVASLHKIV
jgi:hypothetical protein